MYSFQKSYFYHKFWFWKLQYFEVNNLVPSPADKPIDNISQTN